MTGPRDHDGKPAADLDARTKKAVAQCEEQIGWYASHSRADWYLYRTFQVGVIVLSRASPALLLFTDLPKPIQALPAALAALGAAVAAGFHWHEDAVRWATTRELLKSELRQFRTRTGRNYRSSLSEGIALDNSATRMEAIIHGDLST